ncbi:MAG: hypothetical protein OXG55_01065 [bacterium]|nr:hypothetical protein [bacterium]MCY4101845.1 hypothetical protein [bacterium]
MNTAIVSSIIGTVGAAFITVLVFYLQSLRDDIRAVGVRIDKVESSLSSSLLSIHQSLARIETTLEEHGRQLERMADHGERIAALESAGAAVS